MPNQLVLSAIEPKRRAELWNLSAVFIDRPGILAELTNLFADLNIDIVSCKLTTKEQNHHLIIDMDIDSFLYESEFDFNFKKRSTLYEPKLEELSIRIICNFINDIVFSADGNPRIRIVKNKILEDTIDGLKTVKSCVLYKGGVLQLDEDMIDELCADVKNYYPHLNEDLYKESNLFVMIVCEIQTRVLRVFVFFQNIGHIHVRVSADNRRGTIAKLSNELFLSNFNILQLYHRNIDRNTVLIDFLIQLKNDSRYNDIELEKFVKGIFSRNVLTSINCKIEFPKPLPLN